MAWKSWLRSRRCQKSSSGIDFLLFFLPTINSQCTLLERTETCENVKHHGSESIFRTLNEDSPGGAKEPQPWTSVHGQDDRENTRPGGPAEPIRDEGSADPSGLWRKFDRESGACRLRLTFCRASGPDRRLRFLNRRPCSPRYDSMVPI